LAALSEDGNAPIKCIIACLHTRLSPCIARENKDLCSCYTCLTNWPARWKGKSIFSDIPIFMAVSFVDYQSPNSKSLPLDAPNFSMRQLRLPEPKIRFDLAEAWVRTALLKRQVNSLRTGLSTFLPFEEEILSIIRENFGLLEASYIETSDLRDCRTLKIKLPGDREVRKIIDGRDQSLKLAITLFKNSTIIIPFPASTSIVSSPEIDITLEASDDWNILLKLSILGAAATIEEEGVSA